MKTNLITLMIGCFFGMIDILPMLKMKCNKHEIISAFVFYLFLPFIIYNTKLFGMSWWLSGGVITLILAMPVIILVSKESIQNAVPIVLMSVILGTLIGMVGHFWLKVI